MTHWCRDIPRDEAVRAAEDGRSGPLPTLEEAISAVTERRPPEPGGGGNVTGLRTERVTLEITHGESFGVSHWSWVTILRLQSGESVRVVEEAHFDDLAQVAMERDAAIRERDEAKEECERLREKVRVMDGLSRMDIEKEIAVEEAWESCGIRPYWPDDEPGTSHRYAKSMMLEIVKLRARVAELESAAKLAPPANADAESNHATPAASVVLDVITDMTDILRVNADPDEQHAAMATLVEAVCPGWRLAPAASGAAGTVAVSAEQPPSGYAYEYPHYLPPVATVIRFTGGETINGSKPLRAIPYWFAPQPAPGWLTAEERGAVAFAADQAPESDFVTSGEGEWVKETLTALLARSSPPEVVRPGTQVMYHRLSVEEQRDDQWLAAIAAAGVTVKEVGRE